MYNLSWDLLHYPEYNGPDPSMKYIGRVESLVEDSYSRTENYVKIYEGSIGWVLSVDTREGKYSVDWEGQPLYREIKYGWSIRKSRVRVIDDWGLDKEASQKLSWDLLHYPKEEKRVPRVGDRIRLISIGDSPYPDDDAKMRQLLPAGSNGIIESVHDNNMEQFGYIVGVDWNHSIGYFPLLSKYDKWETL